MWWNGGKIIIPTAAHKEKPGWLRRTSLCHVIKMRRVSLFSLFRPVGVWVGECERTVVLSKHKGRNNQCHMAILWLTTPPADSFCQNYCECVSSKGEEFHINFSTLRSCVSIFYVNFPCVLGAVGDFSFCAYNSAFDILQMAELLNTFLSGVPRNNWISRRIHWCSLPGCNAFEEG